MIVIEAFAYEEAPEYFAQMGVSRLVVKATSTNVIEISGKCAWKAIAQIFRTGRLFHRQDKLLLLLLVRGFEILPWEMALEEV